MNIGKVITNAVPKLTNKPTKYNCSGCGDNKDKITFNSPQYNEALNKVTSLKDENGNPRFSPDELDIFRGGILGDLIDVEPIVRFANKTKIPMEDYAEITSLHRDAKEDDLYDKLEKKFDELKEKNITVEHFKQSKFLPEEEFSLDLAKKDEKIVTVSYNTQTMKPVAKKTQEFLDDATIDVKIENLKDNSTHYETIEDGKLIESTITRRDKSGNVLRTEKMRKSPVAGVMNVEYQYPDGKIEKIASGSIDKKTGIVTVKKDMKAPDGTRTEFLYEDDPQGNRLVDYKITGKDGHVIMKNSQTFEVLSENTFRSSNNNDTYDITVGEKDLTVKDVRRDLEAKIDFKNKTKGEQKEVINLLKKIPGNELFEVVDSVHKIKGMPKYNTLEACFYPISKNIQTGDDMYVFLHELGHAKDGMAQKTGLINFIRNPKKAMFTDDPKIQKTWKEERARFNETATDNERKSIDYFIQAKGHYAGEYGGLSELVAETNALTSSILTKNSDKLTDRSQILQQNFPQTIAAIKDKMNYWNDLYAIQYYGT